MDKLYSVKTYPTFYLIDQTGKIAFSEDEFTEKIMDLVQVIIDGLLH